jgi:hypothetical protein
MENQKKLIDFFKKKQSIINSLKEEGNPSLVAKNSFILKTSLYQTFSKIVSISENAKEEIISAFQVFPSIYNDLISSIYNPNCSCRSKVTNFIQENLEFTIQTFNSILEKNPQNENFYEDLFKEIVKLDKQSYPVLEEPMEENIPIENIPIENTENISLAGQIITVDNDEEYYKLINSFLSNNYSFKGLNIIEKDNKIKIYFY